MMGVLLSFIVGVCSFLFSIFIVLIVYIVLILYMMLCCSQVHDHSASWQEEKNQLVQAHYDAKVKLITEIQNLRKALTPSAEQAFKDYKQSEYLRGALEEEVVNTHIHNDNLKVRGIRDDANVLLKRNLRACTFAWV